MQTQSYCLNLHENYAPTWSTWEVARELYANAKDAAPDEMVVKTDVPDILTITTPTAPDISELLIIGHGSKTQTDNNIGQFGEGFKLAALAATRSGGRLIARMAGYRITFALRDHLGTRALFADVQNIADDTFTGLLVQLEMMHADKILNGRVIAGAESAILKKDIGDPCQIFCKGIWISELDEQDTLFSYNLNNVQLNRDRNHVDPWSVRHSIGQLIADKLTPELATTLVKNATSWESKRCLDAAEFSFSNDAKAMLGEAFTRQHGTALLRTDARAASMAHEFGYETILVGDGLRNLLQEVVATDARMMAGKFEFDAIPFNPAWPPILDELRTLSDLCGVRDFEINIFEDTAGAVVGKAQGKTMWLNERLMSPDSRLERVRTFMHELGHIQSGGAHDASVRFEDALDLLLGKLGIAVLDGGIAQLGEVA